MTPDTSLCVFFKPPRAGEVKTRLIAAVGARGAAQLAEAFFRDTWHCVESLSWAMPVVASTELFSTEFKTRRKMTVWLQGDGDLGARIERILQRGLEQTEFAMAIGADSPGIPAQFYEHAHDALKKADAVIGPSDDGGFYLLGLRRCPTGLLSGIPWSQSNTFDTTIERLRESGMNVTIMDSWFDVDRPEDLERLRRELASESLMAPETLEALQRLHMEAETGSLSTAKFDSNPVNV